MNNIDNQLVATTTAY